MTPEQILQNQRDLLTRCDDNLFMGVITGTIEPVATAKGKRRFASNLNAFVSTMRDPRQDAMGGEQALARRVAGYLKATVQTSYAYRVTADMCTLLEHAASQLDETDVVDPTMLPSGCGFVHFERPLPVSDARGQLMLMNWAVWGPTTSGVIVYWFNDYDLTPDIYADEILNVSSRPDRAAREMFLQHVGRWGFVACTQLREGCGVGPAVKPTDSEAAAAILADGKAVYPYTNVDRYMMALWLLLGQTITSATEEHVRSTETRRAHRLGLPGKVTVIALRRHEGSRREGESLVDWSCRWVVRSHWAWRRCSPEHPHAQSYAGGYRCRVWIGFYEKGPEGLPLKANEKLYSLQR